MWEIRTITEEDNDAYRTAVARAFGQDADDTDEARERFRAIFEYDRTLAAIDGGEVLGTASAFSLDVTVPGGVAVPMGGTTVVSVRSTHRRRGMLRALMDRHLADVVAHEEPLAGLWASEAPIYGRFGFGTATWRLNAVIDGSRTQVMAPGAGAVSLVDTDSAKQVAPGIYEKARRARPGMLSRSEAWWSHRVFADPESWRGGKSAKRWVVHETEGVADGYATYRQKSEWDDFVAKGEVAVDEVVATNPAAHLDLWAYLTNVDLFPNVEMWNLAVDDPLLHAVSDSRRVSRSVADALWLKVVDIPRALEARRYESDGRFVLGVDGEAFALEVDDGVADCRPTHEEPAVRMHPDALGHLYLGGGNALAMAAAGRVDGEPEEVRLLHRLFRTDLAPWCSEVF